MAKDKGASNDRRNFLKIAALSAPAAAVTVGSLASDEAQAAPVDLQSDRIQDTAHTRAYYDSTRF